MTRTSPLEWLHRHRFERWRSGALTDKDLVRELRLWVWKTAAGVYLLIVALGSLMYWLEKRPAAGQLGENVLLLLGLLSLVFLPVGLSLQRSSTAAAKNLFIGRDRARAEADTERRAQARSDEPKQVAHLYGSYRQSLRFGGSVAGLGLVAGALYAATRHPEVGLLAATLLLGGLYLTLDRRVQLELSSVGISCRAWGPKRYPYHEFKAVYARRSGVLKGVTLVVRAPEQIRETLSLGGRLALSASDGVTAHRGTLTIWTSKLGLPQHALLASLDADITAAQR